MEAKEPTAPVLPTGKRKPHQVALWLTVGFVALSILITSNPYGILLFFGNRLTYLLWPAIWFGPHLNLNRGWNIIVMIIWGLFVVYSIFYIPVKLWMSSSRHLHIALIAYVILCFGTYEFYQWYSTKPDWSSHGLNPDRPEFKPRVLVLAGEYDRWDHYFKSSEAYFEIRMRGQDNYYCRIWHGNEWKPGSWFRAEIATDGKGWHWGLHCSSFGTGGGGGGWYSQNLPGQRLWNKQKFVGAKKNDLVFKEPHWPKQKEEFSHLVKVGRWLIPTHIRLTKPGNNAWEENYYIKKIEFLPTPGTNWFEQVYQKYADFKSSLRTTDLGKPGVAPGKRK